MIDYDYYITKFYLLLCIYVKQMSIIFHMID